MKVLIVGRTKPFTAEAAKYRALHRLGHTPVIVDDRKLRQLVGRRWGGQYLRAKVRAFRPDRLIFQKPHDVPLEIMAEICERVPSVMWYRDLTIPPDPELVARAHHTDVTFLTAGGQAAEWEAAGAKRALFLPDCADPAWDRPMAPAADMACDVAFIGRGRHEDDVRARFLLRLAERFHVKVFGQAWDRWAKPLDWDGRAVYGADFGRVCASAKIVLGVQIEQQRAHQVWGYQSNRMAKVLAARGFFLGHATAGLRELFVDGEHCAWYDDEDHAVEVIARYLKDDAARERVRRQGHEFLLAHHTFEHRMPNLLTGEPWVNPLTGRAVA